MKKFFLCALIFISFQAFSQVYVGLTGGILYSNSEFKEDSLARPNRGSKLGIEALIPINKNGNYELESNIYLITLISIDHGILVSPFHLPTIRNIIILTILVFLLVFDTYFSQMPN